MSRGSSRLSALPLALSVLLIPNPARAQGQPIYPFKPIYRPERGRPAVTPRGTRPAPRAVASPTGSSCTLVTFEGLADLTAIPTFQGITWPNWMSILETGTNGPRFFTNEPSPVTIAFWVGDDTSENILFPNGASSVSFYYTSAVHVTVTAYDAHGNVVDTAHGAINYDYQAGLFDTWTPISVTAKPNTPIVSITVAGYGNLMGIDDLTVCQVTNIDSVEFTQAIQQYQSLADLQASLTASGEPPVPLISGKPAVLRVYFQEVEDVTNVKVRLSGVSSQTKTLALLPHCSPVNQRARALSCPSMDFYFTPPSGSWQATLDTLDDTGKVLTEQVFHLKSRDTDTIHLRAVSVCDSKDAAGHWLCEDAASLIGKTRLLSKIAPTNLVLPEVTPNVVREDMALFANDKPWWAKTVRDLSACYGLLDSTLDSVVGWYTTYFGEIRPTIAGGIGGKSNGIPSHGAAARTSAIRLGVETNVEVVAHETGHSLGLRHTDEDDPLAAGHPPGCYNLAADDHSDWLFPDNYIQSAAHMEYGFDVVDRKIINPSVNFDVMSYCTPRWISPQRYKTLIHTLGGGVVTTPSTFVAPIGLPDNPQPRGAEPRGSATPSKFWQVRGAIQNIGVQFDPLFQLTVQGDTTQGTGTYSLLELDGTGSAIFTRQFTPLAPQTETTDADDVDDLAFSQVIPVNAGVAAIVVKDPTSLEIGRITLSGSAPTVTIAAPAVGSVQQGTQNVSWTIQNLSGPTSTSKVLYSANGGANWSALGDIPNATSLPVDFDRLPGSTNAVIQVLVSDGVNTGAATSGVFSVPKKSPVVEIDTPLPNAGQPAADAVYLSGTAYDPEDGMLSGAALVWSSNLQGQLGTGSPLSVNLEPGNHTIQLTATDSDGNPASATVQMTIGGDPPAVTIQASPVDTAPTTCENVTVNAQPGAGGAPLSGIQVSLDGGTTYKTLSVSALPFSFLAPGSGFLHMVAWASDTSGQANAKDVTFLTASQCKKVLCDVNQDFKTDVSDVRMLMAEAIGMMAPAHDLNADGKVSVVEVQMAINGTVGKGCAGH